MQRFKPDLTQILSVQHVMSIKNPATRHFTSCLHKVFKNLVCVLHSQCNLSSDAKFSTVKVKCGSAKTMRVLVNTNILHFGFQS